MQISTVLFDADGVIQWPLHNRRDMWNALLGDADKVDEFFAALLALERTCYCGEGDFVGALPNMMRDWQSTGSIEDLLRGWTAIRVDLQVVELIRRLRSGGVRCYLATNQEPFRGRYMSEQLNYRALFDAEFYSCELGCYKPDPNYFVKILNRLELSPGEVLFVDDKDPNTSAAASVGIRTETFMPSAGTRPSSEMQRVLKKYGLMC